MTKKVKFEWEIFIDDDCLVIDLNSQLNSSIPLASSETLLNEFKARKKSEIMFYRDINPTTITGLELLA